MWQSIIAMASMQELKQTLSKEDYEPLKGLLWLFRRDWLQLDEPQQQQLLPLFERAPLLKQAYLLRNLLTFIFDVASNKAKAQEYLNGWRQVVIESGLACFDAFLKTLDTWFDEITNYLYDRHSSGFVEWLNNKLKVIKRRCYGLFNTGHFFQRILSSTWQASGS